MSRRGSVRSLSEALVPLLERSARLLGARARGVLLSRAGGGCEVLEPRLLEPAVLEALAGAAGCALHLAGRRARSALRVATRDLPGEASGLAAALESVGVRSLGLIPLETGEGVKAVLLLTDPELTTDGDAPTIPRGAEGDSGPAGWVPPLDTTDLAQCWAAAGAEMLHQVVRRSEGVGGPVPHGGLVVDSSGRILFVTGAGRDLPGWAREDLVGQRLARLPLGEALTRIALENATGARWSDHGVWNEWDEIPLSVAGQRLDDGACLVLLRDQRQGPSEGVAAIQEHAEALLRATDTIADLRGCRSGEPGSDAVHPPERISEGIRGADGMPRVREIALDGLRFARRLGVDCHLDVNRTFRMWMATRGGALRVEGVRVLSLLAPALSPAAGDRTEVAGALCLLLDHARDALRPGGGTITLRTWEDDGYLHAAISDDGPRGPDVPDGFEALAIRSEAGGVADVLDRGRGILKQVGGRLDMDVRPRVWTRRSVLIPVAIPEIPGSPCSMPESGNGGKGPSELGRVAAPPESGVARSSSGIDGPAAPGRTGPVSGSGRGLHILLADDNVALRRVVKRYLERRGHRVTEAADGLEALDLVRDQRFDRLLIDLHMPGCGGREVFEALSELAPDLRSRAVFMSGGTTEAGLLRFLGESGRPEVQKPFDLRDMALAVER